MRIFGRDIPGHDAERAALREARRELEEQTAGQAEETEDFYRLNQAVADAEQDVPWHLRW